MNASKTSITLVLDRSGSMGIIKTDTIGGVNEFIRTQKAVPGEADFTLAQFDDVYEVVTDGVALRDAKELTLETYIPRNSTALLDAIGKTINWVGGRLAALPEAQRPGKVVFVIITDGQENASTTFTRPQIFEMIKHQRETYKWEFVFIGANQDAIAEGGEMGFTASQAINYAATPIGSEKLYAAAADNLAAFRTSRKVDMAWEDDQRKDQDDELKKGGLK